MLQQALDKVRNQVRLQFTRILDYLFKTFSHAWPRPQGKNWKTCCLMKDGYCTSALQLDQGHNYEAVDRNESVSPVGNIVIKCE